MFGFRRHVVVLALILLSASAGQMWAADSGNEFAHAASNSVGPFLVVGELSLLTDGKTGTQEMVQGAKALFVTGVATEALKVTIPDKRPTGNGNDSFPSGHTSMAFAMATLLADYQPQYKWLAYCTATAIGWSRIQVHAHELDEVIAGALLGHYVAKHFTSQDITVTPGGVSWKF